MIRKRWILALALSWLLVGTVGFVIAQSSPSVPYIMGGSYPGAPDYTIWTESSTFFAKDANGQIDFSGTNASEVIEDTLATFDKGAPEDNGGRLLIRSGTYTGLTGAFELVDGTTVEGEGIHTYLDMGAYNQPLFNVTGYNVQIKNLNLQGNLASGGANAHGIAMYSAAAETITGLWIQNNLILNFNKSGIYINGAGGSFQDLIFIVNNNIYANGEDGVYVGGTCWETYIQDNSISNNGRHGISINNAGEIVITGNDIYENDNRGVYAYIAAGFDISNNEFSANGFDGILVEDCVPARSVIADNRLYNNDALGGGSSGVTILDSNQTVVTGNFASTWADDWQDFGIREMGTSNWNIFIGNYCLGVTAGIVQLGANSIFQHNINGTV